MVTGGTPPPAKSATSGIAVQVERAPKVLERAAQLLGLHACKVQAIEPRQEDQGRIEPAGLDGGGDQGDDVTIDSDRQRVQLGVGGELTAQPAQVIDGR